MKKGIMALTLTLVMGLGASAYAATTTTTGNANKNTTTCQGEGFGRATGQKGYTTMTNILKNKLGLSDKDITSALNSGKTMHDIAKEKGMSDEQLKAAMLEEKTKAIDSAVSKGTLSKEEGETLKTQIKDNMANCTTPGEMRGKNSKGAGQGKDMGMGRNSCNQNLRNTK